MEIAKEKLDGFSLADFDNVIESFHPVNEWILGKPIVLDKVGSVYVLDTYAQTQLFTKVFVVSTGEGALSNEGVRIPNTVEPGDTVLIRASTDINISGEKLKIFTERNVIGVYNAYEDT